MNILIDKTYELPSNRGAYRLLRSIGVDSDIKSPRSYHAGYMAALDDIEVILANSDARFVERIIYRLRNIDE